MHIDSYEFGHIVIDGASLSSDCLIYGGQVKPDWWRKHGHTLSPADLQPIIEAQPSVLVVGCGAYGIMKVPDNIRKLLAEHNIALQTFDTHKAVERFNTLCREGVDVAAALHLTC